MAKPHQTIRIRAGKKGEVKPGPDEDERPAETRVFITQLTAQDIMTAIITLATYAEYVMTEKIRSSVRNPQALGKKAAGLAYRQMLSLCMAIPLLPTDLEKALKVLAEMRNDFAHDINHTMTEDEAKRFMTALPADLHQEKEGASVMEQFETDRAALALELMRCLHSPKVDRKTFQWDLFQQVMGQDFDVAKEQQRPPQAT